jgi:uncharacterized GH25 family protein
MGSTVIQTLTAVTYSITLNSLPTLASEGSTVGFSGTLTANGSGVPGATIRIDYTNATGDIAGTVGTTTTDNNGNFSLNWKIPYGLGCQQYYFYAVDVASGTISNKPAMKIGVNTRIVLSLPQTVTVNKPFTVSGTLQWYDGSSWKPLPNMKVTVSLDGNVVAQPTTDANGNFSATITITSAGSHSIMAQFAGTS